MKKRIIMLISLFMLGGCGSSGFEIHTMAEETASKAEEGLRSTEILDEPAKEAEEIVIYVCGAVRNEGVYKLPLGSRAEDALKAAGGYSEDAAKGVVNLAGLLTDGEQIIFPREGEEDDMYKTGTEGVQQNGGRININTADITLLMTLPGIGESRAADIISYREKHGAFEKTEDLMKVSGIKEATWQKLKDRIAVK